MRDGILSDTDHGKFDALLERILDAYKAGQIDRTKAVASIMHVVAAVDKGNTTDIGTYLDPNNAAHILGH